MIFDKIPTASRVAESPTNSFEWPVSRAAFTITLSLQGKYFEINFIRVLVCFPICENSRNFKIVTIGDTIQGQDLIRHSYEEIGRSQSFPEYQYIQ